MPRFVVGLVLVLIASAAFSDAAPATAARPADSGITLTAEGSPFNPNGDGKRERIKVSVAVPVAAKVSLRVVDFNGRRVKVLAAKQPLVAGSHSWTWGGRDGSGETVAFGPYRVKATVDSGSSTVQRTAWVTRARRVPYAIQPGAITIALDAGHGGPAAGAVWRGLREDATNLDITKRLEAMLKGAGIGVVMTRRTDRNVSPTGKDISGDGRYSRLDELIARNDIGNQARADIHLALHNNASACHCTRGTEMYTHFKRSWSPEGRRLATFLLDEHIVHLGRLPGYSPRRRGVASYPFKALKPFHRRLMPRPSLQPSVLGESLFIDWPSENRILSRRSGRTAVAAAYFDGIARYLAWRPYGLRYEILEAPRTAAPGSKVSVRVRLTNTGHRSSSAWRLAARVVKKVRRYDGRPRRGDVVASKAIPDGLAPGASVELTLSGVPMPASPGQWLLKLDVRTGASGSLSKHGVVGPQLRVRTVPS